MDKSFQRKGGKSNTEVGKEFEEKVKKTFENYFKERKKAELCLKKNFEVKIGLGNSKKTHKFDWGSEKEKVLIECKSYKWTEEGNVPDAKLAKLDQTMLYFLASPKNYRKILCVLRDYRENKKGEKETLAQYYIRTHGHLIPQGVEIWEYDEDEQKLFKKHPKLEKEK